MYAVLERCSVVGTSWDAAVPNRIYSCEGALIRRADIASVM